MPEYTEEHARSGLEARLPPIDCWPNQFQDYVITISVPEYTSICPKTGLPDFGKLTVRYEPAQLCVELKSFKTYVLGYRNLGIFYENAVNRILKDFVAACAPVWAEIRGEFTPRGGLTTTVEARYDSRK